MDKRGRCKHKTVIQCLHTSSGFATSHREKEEELFNFFSSRLGQSQQREQGLNYQNINLPCFDLHDQEQEFSIDELQQVIFSMPAEKAPSQMVLLAFSSNFAGPLSRMIFSEQYMPSLALIQSILIA